MVRSLATVADVKALLGLRETQLPLDVARDCNREEKKRQMATEPKMMKHENDKGLKFIRHRDHNHLQEPGGAMKGK